jgi:hypothetical protein
MLTIKNLHTNACFNAWINCENLLTEVHEIRDYISKKVINTLDECAHICLGTFHALKTGSVNSKNMALLCVGICEECAELCESHHGSAFKECARICRDCANTMSEFTLA